MAIPREIKIFETMYVVDTVLGGPTPIVSTSADIEAGSRLGTILNKPGPTAGVKQNFAGTFIPYSSAIPPGASFAAIQHLHFMGVHARIVALADSMAGTMMCVSRVRSM